MIGSSAGGALFISQRSAQKGLLGLLLCLFVGLSATRAQTPTPFSCQDAVSYRIQSNPSQLYTVNMRSRASTLLFSATQLGNRNLTGLGYNPLDNFLYASVSGTNDIVRIGANGVVQLIDVPGLPDDSFEAGDISLTGLFYLYSASQTQMWVVNLNNLAVNAITVQASNLPDLVVSRDGNHIYGLSADDNKLIDYPIGGGNFTATTVRSTGPATDVTSAYQDRTGDLFFTTESDQRTYEVTGPSFPIYGSATLVNKYTATATALTNTDGARCPNSLAATQTPFTCQSGQSFVSTQAIPGGTCINGNSFLVEYDLNTATLVNQSGTLIDSDLNIINNLGYNPTDNYLWAYRFGTNQLVRIDQNRTVDFFAIPGLSNTCDDFKEGTLANNTFFAGDVSRDGVMYLLNGVQGDRFVRVDLNPTSPTYLQKLSDLVLPANFNPGSKSIAPIQDAAFNPVDGQLYTVSNTNNLIRFNPTTGAGTTLGTVSGLGTVRGYVIDYFDDQGNFYTQAAADNTANIYKIANVAGGGLTATIWKSGANSYPGGDGARCPNSSVKSVILSGTVFHDTSNDNTVNGTPVSSLQGNTFYANLVNESGQVAASTSLTSGTYSFTVAVSSSYTLILSNTPGAVGSAPPSTTLANSVINTGEHIGTGPGSDGTADGVIQITVATSAIASINFGVKALPDLTPIIYARPSTVYGTTPITVVVDVVELLGTPTNGLITVLVTKDSKINLSFDPKVTFINNRPVQNSLWTLDANANSSYYTLTTSNVVAAGNRLSFGFSGTLTPGATSGKLTMSSVILGLSGGEVRVTNNVDADKIDYFQK